MTIKLSVLLATYNQEMYIRHALDSVLKQKTDFDFEIILHDDASTDGTVEIIKEYEKKYPDIIKPIYQKENQWSKGVNFGAKVLYQNSRGKYIALCDGDDYWTDEYKLQKQVDFLEANPDFSICFHPVKIIYEEAPEMEDIYPEPGRRFNKTVFDFDDMIQRNFIPTISIVYRKSFDNIQDLAPDRIAPYDWYLHLMHAKLGKVKFLENIMAVYRRQPEGVWYVDPYEYKDGKLDGLYVKNWYEMGNFFYNVLNNIVDNPQEYKEICLNKRIKQIYDALLNHSKFAEIEQLREWFPDTIAEFEKKEICK